MKKIISGVFLLFLFSLSNCESKKNQIEIYFHENAFSFPTHLVKSKTKFYDIDQGEYINDFKENDYLKYTEQSFQLLKEELLDKDFAFVVEQPIVYLSARDTLFSIGVSTYKPNLKAEESPCEGCEKIDNNRIFKTGNRAIFKIDKTSNRLVFKNWEN